MKTVIVIPTYNEEGNIGRLLPMLSEEFSQIQNHECHVLIVDGNSTDRTQEIILGFAKENLWVHLMVETAKEGLGAAYVKGFKKAMHELGAEIVMEMDGDLQHNPKDVKRFLAAIDEGADYVLGSRYVEGGSVPAEWGIHRKILSWGGSAFARSVLGVRSVKDFTTGFKATRVKGIMDQLDFTEVMSSGFAYKIDLLYKTHKLGAKIKEIPIEFGLRDRGDSKMEQGNMIDSLKVVLSIRSRESASFLKFLVVGVTGTFVDFGFANLLKFSNMPSASAAAMAAFIAMLVTFSLNNIWSFKQKKINGATNVMKTLVPYIGFSLVPIAFRFWFVGLTTNMFGDTYLIYNLAIALSVVLGIMWNYFIYSRIIWKTSGKASAGKDSKETKVVSDDDELKRKLAEKMAEIEG